MIIFYNTSLITLFNKQKSITWLITTEIKKNLKKQKLTNWLITMFDRQKLTTQLITKITNKQNFTTDF